MGICGFGMHLTQQSVLYPQRVQIGINQTLARQEAKGLMR